MAEVRSERMLPAAMGRVIVEEGDAVTAAAEVREMTKVAVGKGRTG